MALAMLPHFAFVARDAVRAIVPVLAMLTADRAVEVPLVFVLAQLLQLLLVLLFLRLQLPL